MTDADYERVKGMLRQIVNEWYPALGLGWWEIDFEYVRETQAFDGDDELSLHRLVTAKTQVQWEYLQGCVSFCIPRMTDLDYEAIENIVIHELMHVFVAEMRYCMKCNCYVSMFDEKHEERVVTQLAKVLGWTRKHFETPKAEREAGPFTDEEEPVAADHKHRPGTVRRRPTA